MKIEPGEPFISWEEYEVFLHNYCHKCTRGKKDEDGFAALPRNGGCPVCHQMKCAMYGNDEFPSKSIVKLIDEDEGTRVYHVCRYFATKDKKLMKDYELLLEDLKSKGGRNETEGQQTMKVIESDKIIPLIRLILMNNPYPEPIIQYMQELIDLHSFEISDEEKGNKQ